MTHQRQSLMGKGRNCEQIFLRDISQKLMMPFSLSLLFFTRSLYKSAFALQNKTTKTENDSSRCFTHHVTHWSEEWYVSFDRDPHLRGIFEYSWAPCVFLLRPSVVFDPPSRHPPQTGSSNSSKASNSYTPPFVPDKPLLTMWKMTESKLLNFLEP